MQRQNLAKNGLTDKETGILTVNTYSRRISKNKLGNLFITSLLSCRRTETNITDGRIKKAVSQHLYNFLTYGSS